SVSPSKNTIDTYIGGFVYEQVNGGISELQFFSQEEGRVRPQRDIHDSITGYTYDYFLKDHLGNVRMVLTEEQKTDAYPAATMELVDQVRDTTYYSNINNTRTLVSGISGYPIDNSYSNPNQYVAKVNGTGNK